MVAIDRIPSMYMPSTVVHHILSGQAPTHSRQPLNCIVNVTNVQSLPSTERDMISFWPGMGANKAKGGLSYVLMMSSFIDLSDASFASNDMSSLRVPITWCEPSNLALTFAEETTR
jgi:hypothetical protein